MLKELGKKYQTMKINHTFNNKNIMDHYETYLFKIKDNKLNFLEIGVLDGCSLNMWEEYLPNSKITAIDINPDCKKYSKKNVEVFIGSQDDYTFLKTILKNGPFDVILDDGSHVNELTIKSFNFLFPHLKNGGIYIIEDTHCTYEPALITWPGMIYNSVELDLNNKRSVFLEFINDLIKNMDLNSGQVQFVHFYSKTCIIKKND